jgi:hypothetical protein
MILVGPSILVASRTTPGVWYIYQDGHCSCPGFTYYGRCHHVAAARTAEELDRAVAQPVTQPERDEFGCLVWCSDCGSAKAEIGTRCAHCHDVYWAKPAPINTDAETDQQKLERLSGTLARFEAQSGRHAGVRASQLRREVIKLSAQIAAQN